MATDPVPDPSPNELLRRLSKHKPTASRYKLVGEIARGGMGSIIKVWDEDLRRHLAMKVVFSKGESVSTDAASPVESKQLARFLEEAQVTSQLDHPGIVPVHELGIDDNGRAYFTMKLVKGRDLKTIFDLVFEGDEGWNETRALGVLLKVCESVAYAHTKGVIHRDLKPANVMVGRFGEVYVMDWGLSRVLGREDTHDIRIKPEFPTSLHSVKTDRRDEREEHPDSPIVTMDGDVMGTPTYMSPEQARGEIHLLSPRADVYAIGAMLYHLLARQAPYVPPLARLSNRTVLGLVVQGPPAPLTALRGDAPAELVAIVEKAMSRESLRRYPDTLTLADDLRAFLEGRVVSAYETGAWAEARKWVMRNTPLAASLAAVLVAIVIGGIAFAIKANEANLRANDLALETQRAQSSERLARENSYVAAVVGAGSAWRADEPMTARRLLDSAPSDLRHWEWRYIDYLLDKSLLRLDGHSAGVATASFSPDGSRIVTASDDHTARVWDARSGKELAKLVGHSGAVSTASFNSSASQIVTASVDHTARVWDASTGRPIASLEGHSESVACAAFSIDGSRVVTASSDMTSCVWQASSGRLLARLVGHAGPLTSAAFSPDGTRVLTTSSDSTAQLWDATGGPALERFVGHTDKVCSAQFAPDGSRIVTASDDHTARVWDARTGKELVQLVGHTGPLLSAYFSFDGGRIVTASADRSARVWDASNGKELALLNRHKGVVGPASFSPDGSRIVTASADTSARIWDAATGQELMQLEGHVSPVTTAFFSPDGSRIVTACSDATARLWDALNSSAVVQLRGHKGQVRFASFSPDGSRIVTASADNTARVWDAMQGTELARLDGHKGAVYSAAYSPDGRRIITASQDKTVRLWDAQTGRELLRCEGHTSYVTRALFSRDGSRVVTASGDKTSRIWDATTGRELLLLEGHTDEVSFASFSPDGLHIVTSSVDGTARIWNASNGRQTARLDGHTGCVASACFSPDGLRIVTASFDRTGRVWDATSGTELVKLLGHKWQLYCASFSPDGRRIVTASLDDTARVWDATTGKELARLDDHERAVASAFFSPDGSRIVTASWDWTARVKDCVPYRVHHEQQEQLTSARSEAELVLAQVLASANNWSAAATRLRSDSALSETTRRVALGLLTQRANQTLPNLSVLGLKRSEFTWLARMLGREHWPTERDVDATIFADPHVSEDSEQWNHLAWTVVNPDAPQYGDEVRALIFARRAVDAASVPGAQSIVTGLAGRRDTLARALFRLGRFDEAIQEQTKAINDAPTESKAQYHNYLERLKSDISFWRDEAGRLREHEVTQRFDALRREIADLEENLETRLWLNETN